MDNPVIDNNPEKAVSPKIVLGWIMQDLLLLVVGAVLSLFFLIEGFARLIWFAINWIREQLAEKPSSEHPALTTKS
jgi:hypothetical protein